MRIFERALRDGAHLTRAELGTALRAKGIDTAGQRLAFMVMHAELELLVCSGAMRGKQHTYALVDERAPAAAAMSRDEALAKLALRYFESHGPAQPQDFAWWSGLTVADAVRGIDANGSALESAELAGKRHWFGAGSAPPAKPRPPIVHLLPNYDEAFIGYRDRSAMQHPRVTQERAVIEEVLYAHVVTVNGQIAGGWRRGPASRAHEVDVTLLAELTAAENRALRAAVRRYGAFSDEDLLVNLTLRAR
jgi:hypothetical protein